jgi:hypothetical protein
MDDLTVIGNQVEAVLWFFFALGFSWKGCKTRHPDRRRLSWMLVVAFAMFGVSDIIESTTGAWWRPWWLFVLKAGCVAVFAYGFLAFRSIRKQEPTGSAVPAHDDASR